MATNVVLPALGMSQETGKVVRWLKAEGEQVTKGEPLAEIETDKATVELEAPATGFLAHITAAIDAEIPVGQVIAVIESSAVKAAPGDSTDGRVDSVSLGMPFIVSEGPVAASPLASRVAAEHSVDLNQVKSAGRRIQKADVLAYLQDREIAPSTKPGGRLVMASPKARRLAVEQGKDLTTIKGTGPEGAVLAADVLAAERGHASPLHSVAPAREDTPATIAGELTLSNIWRIMAERTTQSWTSVPHFYLVREVNASRLMLWREQALKRSAAKVTYTDLLVKIVAATLRIHPRLNASWSEGKVTLKEEVHIGLAVAVEEGLVVPVIHQADKLSLSEIAQQRQELVTKAQVGKLRPQDISGGTFTISNLGMYGVDAFNAIINQPQVAILAVGRIAERVVPMNGQPAIQLMVLLTLSCDHRAVDGARGAQFLDTVAALIEEPLGLLG
jgi:pyruvate dehydrogenase E2 component (dihydrolipoamide acetyltransferase)